MAGLSHRQRATCSMMTVTTNLWLALVSLQPHCPRLEISLCDRSSKSNWPSASLVLGVGVLCPSLY